MSSQNGSGWGVFIAKLSRLSNWLVMMGLLGLIGLRRVTFFTYPRLWAEEGTLHFPYAFRHPGWGTLLTPQIGYLNFWANLAAIVASQAPLEAVPLVTTLMGLAVQLIPPAWILWNEGVWRGWLRKAGGLVVYFFMANTQETWLNSLNSFNYFILVAFLILLDPPPANRLRRWAGRGLLLLSGLSGVTANFLLPLFAWRWWGERSRERLVQFFFFLAGGLVQVAAVLRYSGNKGVLERMQGMNPLTLTTAIWGQTISYLSLGFDRSKAAMLGLVENNPGLSSGSNLGGLLIALGVVILLVGLTLALRKAEERVVFMGSYGLLMGLSLLFTVDQDPANVVVAGETSRLFMAANVIFGWMVLWIALEAPGWRTRGLAQRLGTAAAVLLLTSGLLWGGSFYWRRWVETEAWPVWRVEIAKWRADNEYRIKIQPPNWTMHLVPPDELE